MGFNGNVFALLVDDDGDTIENFLSRAAVKVEEPPSVAANQAKFQTQSKTLNSSNHAQQKTGQNCGSEWPNGNGVSRYNAHANDSRQNYGPGSNFRSNNGEYRQSNDSRQNNGGNNFRSDNGGYRQNDDSRQNNKPRNDFKSDNGGYRQNNGDNYDLRRYNGHANGYNRDEKPTDGCNLSNDRMPNVHHQRNYSDSTGNGDKVNMHVSSRGNSFGRERAHGPRGGFNRENPNGNEVNVVGDKGQQEGQWQVKGSGIKKLNEVNSYYDERPYNRNGNLNSDGNSGGHGPKVGFNKENPNGNEVNDVENKGQQEGEWQVVKGSGKKLNQVNAYNNERQNNRSKNWNSGSNRGGYGWGSNGGFRHESSVEGKNDFESNEIVEDKVVQKDNGDNNAAGAELVDTAIVKTDSKNGKAEKVLSKEEAERLVKWELEAKQMTLKEYEKQVEEKKKLLESRKMEERRVTLDKEFESMQKIDGKKNDQEESTSMKLVNTGSSNKLKKVSTDDKVKVSTDKDENPATPKPLVLNFKPAGGANQSGRRGGGFPDREGNKDGINSAGGNSKQQVKKIVDRPPSIQDANQFPVLGASMKSNP